MSDLYAHKKYNINPRLKAIIEAKMGKQVDLMNHQLDNLISEVYHGKYTSLVSKLSDTDKEKIIVQLKEQAPTTSDEKKNKSVADFFKENFEQEQIDDYINHCITNVYKPGMLAHGLKVNTKGIIDFLDVMLVEMLMGFVINKNYMNDALNIIDIDETEPHDTRTLLAINDLSKKYSTLKKQVSKIDYTYVYENDDILVVATDDISTLNILQTYIDADDCIIPKDYFQWGKTDFNGKPQLGQIVEQKEEELSENDKANALISKNVVVIDEEITEEDTTENGDNNIPPDAPRERIFQADEPTDVIFNGVGYGVGGIELDDDYSSFDVVFNGKKIREYHDCDGGIVITKFDKDDIISTIKCGDPDHSIVDEGIPDWGVEFSLMRGFVGNINLVVKSEDDNGNIIYLDTSTFDGDIIDNFESGDVIFEIDGNFTKYDSLTLADLELGDNDDVEDTTETLIETKNDGIIPPNTPRQTLFETSKPIDVFLNGNGYSSGVKLTDDETSISVVGLNKKIIDYVTCDGGFGITELNKSIIDKLKVEFSSNGSYGSDEAFEYYGHYIISNFVGKINLIVKFKYYDQNDEGTVIYLDPSKIAHDHLQHPFFGTAYEDKYDDYDVSIILEIDGTYQSVDKMTHEMFKNF